MIVGYLSVVGETKLKLLHDPSLYSTLQDHFMLMVDPRLG
jgi:hypothetical protein